MIGKYRIYCVGDDMPSSTLCELIVAAPPLTSGKHPTKSRYNWDLIRCRLMFALNRAIDGIYPYYFGLLHCYREQLQDCVSAKETTLMIWVNQLAQNHNNNLQSVKYVLRIWQCLWYLLDMHWNRHQRKQVPSHASIRTSKCSPRIYSYDFRGVTMVLLLAEFVFIVNDYSYTYAKFVWVNVCEFGKLGVWICLK